MIDKLWEEYKKEEGLSEEDYDWVSKTAFYCGAVKMWQLLEQAL